MASKATQPTRTSARIRAAKTKAEQGQQAIEAAAVGKKKPIAPKEKITAPKQPTTGGKKTAVVEKAARKKAAMKKAVTKKPAMEK